MNNFFRAIIAGWGAKKLGGGCLSTIVIFIIIWVALGQCNERSVAATPGINIETRKSASVKRLRKVAVCVPVRPVNKDKR